MRDAGGPIYTTSYHAIWEWAAAALDGMPAAPSGAGDRSRASRGRAPPRRARGPLRHGDRSRPPLLDAAGPALLGAGWNGDAASVRDKLAAAGQAGITEVMYAPAADIPGEIEAFAAAAAG